MGDFVEQTALEEIGEGRYRAVLAPEWMTWGPTGGYVAAIALRAAGAASAFERPASLSCQYLRVAKFDAVELRVRTRRLGRRSQALQVTMVQEGSEILDASVWAVTNENDGLEHDYTRAPDVPLPDELPEPAANRPARGITVNFERRQPGGPPADGEAREPIMRNWFRFRPTPRADDRFIDAARAIILLDLFSWPATWPAHPSDGGPSAWIAPNLDLHVRFHHDSRPHDWLLCETRADLAADGLIGTTGAIWSPKGHLIAASSSQLFCRPRPEQFR